MGRRIGERRGGRGKEEISELREREKGERGRGREEGEGGRRGRGRQEETKGPRASDGRRHKDHRCIRAISLSHSSLYFSVTSLDLCQILWRPPFLI